MTSIFNIEEIRVVVSQYFVSMYGYIYVKYRLPTILNC